MPIKYRNYPHINFAFNIFFVCPAPLFPWLIIHPKVIIPAIPSARVSLASAYPSFCKFVIYCFLMLFFLRQTRQTNFPQYIHVCACARGILFYLFLTLYFEFVRKWSDVSDAFNAGADRGLTESPFQSDASLTRADANLISDIAGEVGGSFQGLFCCG